MEERTNDADFLAYPSFTFNGASTARYATIDFGELERKLMPKEKTFSDTLLDKFGRK